MSSPRKLHLCPIVLAAAAVALGGTAATASAAQGRLQGLRSVQFVAATLVRGQGARVNIVNLANPADTGPRGLPPDPCRGSVQFYDAAGAPLGDAQDFELAPGQATSLADPTGGTGGNNTDIPQVRHARPVVTLGSNALRVPVLLPPDPCNSTNAVFEVYSTDTRRTESTIQGQTVEGRIATNHNETLLRDDA